MRVTSPGPDFICVGMPKCGTTWLYGQLRRQHRFWMPPIKELHYFDVQTGADPRPSLGERAIKRRNKRNSADERNASFFHAATTIARGERGALDLDAYKALFAPKGDLLSGDITPAYSLITEDHIAEIAKALPDTKVILLLRDPVARVWSHMNMFQRRGQFAEGMLENHPVEAARHYLSRNRAMMKSSPSLAYEKWSRHFPSKFFFMEDLVANDLQYLEDVCAFIGMKEIPEIHDSPRKKRFETVPISDTARDFIAGAMREEIERCASMFGGHAERWGARTP